MALTDVLPFENWWNQISGRKGAIGEFLGNLFNVPRPETSTAPVTVTPDKMYSMEQFTRPRSEGDTALDILPPDIQAITRAQMGSVGEREKYNRESIMSGVRRIDEAIRNLNRMFSGTIGGIESSLSSEPYSEKLKEFNIGRAFDTIQSETDSLLRQASDALTSRGLGRGSTGWQAGGGIRGAGIQARQEAIRDVESEQMKTNLAAQQFKSSLIADLETKRADATKQLESIGAALRSGDIKDTTTISKIMGDAYSAAEGLKFYDELIKYAEEAEAKGQDPVEILRAWGPAFITALRPSASVGQAGMGLLMDILSGGKQSGNG